MPSTSGALSARSAGNMGAPVNGTAASASRKTRNRTKPATVPAIAETMASTAATMPTCRGVAPTRRIAAKRCSRRVAARRVVVPTRMTNGKMSAAATTPSTSCNPDVGIPDQQPPGQSVGATVAMVPTRRTPGRCDNSAGE